MLARTTLVLRPHRSQTACTRNLRSHAYKQECIIEERQEYPTLDIWCRPFLAREGSQPFSIVSKCACAILGQHTTQLLRFHHTINVTGCMTAHSWPNADSDMFACTYWTLRSDGILVWHSIMHSCYINCHNFCISLHFCLKHPVKILVSCILSIHKESLFLYAMNSHSRYKIDVRICNNLVLQYLL